MDPDKDECAQSKVKKTMDELKAGTLKSGSGKTVTNPKQAIAIGLSEARQSGAKVPRKEVMLQQSLVFVTVICSLIEHDLFCSGLPSRVDER